MLEKIIKMFFVKTKVESKKGVFQIRRRENQSYNIQKEEKKENLIKVNTCLSSYFKDCKGLNLIERGYSNSKIECLRLN